MKFVLLIIFRYRRTFQGERSDEGQNASIAFGNGATTSQEKRETSSSRCALHDSMGSSNAWSHSQSKLIEFAVKLRRKFQRDPKWTGIATL